FFFFQAEDGIRDRNVTGVQTCALPILNLFCFSPYVFSLSAAASGTTVCSIPSGIPPVQENCHLLIFFIQIFFQRHALIPDRQCRSEERRVGKEWRSRWGREQ